MNHRQSLLHFAGKVVLVHTLTYFIFGIIFSNLFNYEELFNLKPISDFMRSIDSPWVIAGPFLQPLRGLILAIALWPLRQLYLAQKNGWLLIWGLFVVFGILSPPAAAPCSIEGVIYSKLPLWYHLLGLPEIMLQTLAFSLILFGWERKKDLPQPALNPAKPEAIQLFRAVVIGCYAYIGYAVSALLCFFIASLKIDLKSTEKIAIVNTTGVNLNTAASDLKLQLMFVVALLANVICIYQIKRQNIKKPLSNRVLFLFFWAVDTMVPFFYHSFILGGVPAFHYTLLMGFFPAVIIWLNLRIKGVTKKVRQGQEENRRKKRQCFPANFPNCSANFFGFEKIFRTTRKVFLVSKKFSERPGRFYLSPDNFPNHCPDFQLNRLDRIVLLCIRGYSKNEYPLLLLFFCWRLITKA